jgi:hypothetical protein
MLNIHQIHLKWVVATIPRFHTGGPFGSGTRLRHPCKPLGGLRCHDVVQDLWCHRKADETPGLDFFLGKCIGNHERFMKVLPTKCIEKKTCYPILSEFIENKLLSKFVKITHHFPTFSMFAVSSDSKNCHNIFQPHSLQPTFNLQTKPWTNNWYSL